LCSRLSLVLETFLLGAPCINLITYLLTDLIRLYCVKTCRSHSVTLCNAHQACRVYCNKLHLYDQLYEPVTFGMSPSFALLLVLNFECAVPNQHFCSSCDSCCCAPCCKNAFHNVWICLIKSV